MPNARLYLPGLDRDAAAIRRQDMKARRTAPWEGSTWDPDRKCWYVPTSHPNAPALTKQFGGPAPIPAPGTRFSLIANQRRQGVLGVFDTNTANDFGHHPLVGLVRQRTENQMTFIAYDGVLLGGGPLAAFAGRQLDPTKPLSPQIEQWLSEPVENEGSKSE